MPSLGGGGEYGGDDPTGGAGQGGFGGGGGLAGGYSEKELSELEAELARAEQISAGYGVSEKQETLGEEVLSSILGKKVSDITPADIVGKIAETLTGIALGGKVGKAAGKAVGAVAKELTELGMSQAAATAAAEQVATGQATPQEAASQAVSSGDVGGYGPGEGGGPIAEGVAGLPGVTPPADQVGLAGEADGYSDPLAVFGDQYPTTLSGSAAAGIAQQEAHRQKILEMYMPYYTSAAEGALPSLEALATGGETGYTPSATYEYQKETGERNIRRQQAARGLLGSSATADIMTGFRSDIAAEDIERYSAGQLARLQLGTQAADVASSASATLGGNVGSIYSNLGGQVRLNEISQGLQNQSLYQGLANTLSNFAQYMGGE